VDEDQAVARGHGAAKRQGLAVRPWREREALVGAEQSDGVARRGGAVHQVHALALADLAFGLGRLVPDQVPPQEGGDEAVGVPEAEAPAEARVRDAAAQVAARRGAAHERDRVGARRDARHDVEPERRRLVPPPPPPAIVGTDRAGLGRRRRGRQGIERHRGSPPIELYIYPN